MTYQEAQQALLQRLDEPAPGRVQLLTGPRQVGKTTLLLDIAEKRGKSAVYAAADGPAAALPGFWERLWSRAEDAAAEHGSAVVLVDEAHLLPNWASRLKGEWDRLRRRRIPVHVVMTGSSALRLSTGSRESLAGRFERLTLTHWSAAAISRAFAIPKDEAVDMVVRLGAYPGALDYRHQLARWEAYVRDAIVEPAIGRDMLALSAIRKPALLRQVFAVCATSPAQIVPLQKIQGQLQDSAALETIAHYLSLLQEAYLVAPLPKYASTAMRRRAAPPKLVVLSNAFLAVTDPQGIPGPERAPDRFGAWVENACLAHAWNAGQQVAYWREEPFEVDAIIEGSWGQWALEVKTGPIQPAELRGLLEFCRRYPKFKPLVAGGEATATTCERVDVPWINWRDFLMTGPPA